MRYPEGSCECGCAPAYTSCHNWLKLRNNIEIYMFSYLQVLENYLLWYKIYSSYFWVIFIRNSCGHCLICFFFAFLLLALIPADFQCLDYHALPSKHV